MLCVTMFCNILINRGNFTKPVNIMRHVAQSVCRNSTILNQYSEEKQECILKVLNSFPETPPNVKISKGQSKTINSYLKEKKEFKSLGEALSLKGIGPSFLQKLCNGIFEDGTASLGTIQTAKFKSNHLIPFMSEDQRKVIKSVTALEIGNCFISWVRLDCETKTVTDWSQFDYSSTGDVKGLMNVYAFILNFYGNIPSSDVYVFENKNWSMMSPQTNLHIHIRAAQISAILLTLLNNNNNKSDDHLKEFSDRVYFLKTYLPARYFGTLIAAERVSPQKMVEDMFDSKFPDQCTPISFEDHCKQYYFSIDKPMREVLCHSLLLNITFMDIALYNKVEQLKPVKRKQRNYS